jgi:hypothetical protein
LIVRGIKRLDPTVDILRVQESGLLGAKDPEVLEWAARERRAVLSRDRATMRNAAIERILAEKPMPGLFLLKRRWRSCRRRIMEEIILVANCSEAAEWEGRIEYLPF